MSLGHRTRHTICHRLGDAAVEVGIGQHAIIRLPQVNVPPISGAFLLIRVSRS